MSGNYPDDVTPASFDRYWSDKLGDPPETRDEENLMTFEEAWDYADSIPGSFTPLNGEMLWKYAVRCTGTIVEVGVDQGRSASVLLAAARHGGAEVVLVDSWESLLIDNKAKVEALVDRFADVCISIVHATSITAAPLVFGAIDLIHIDANHYDNNPSDDCEAWLPKLKSGGVVCFHDYKASFPAVTAAVDRYTGAWEDLGVWESLAIRRKP